MGGGGRRLAAVDRIDMAPAVVANQKAAAADARALRLDHGQRDQHRERRIGGAAPGAQHLGPGLRRARIGGADHAFVESGASGGAGC